MDDAVITGEEQGHLDGLINKLNLPPAQVRAMHESYLNSLAYAVQRDGFVSADEQHMLRRVAIALSLDDFKIPEKTELPRMKNIKLGMRVCFTGAAQDAQGNSVERSELEEIAASHGLQPVAGVTKSNCDRRRGCRFCVKFRKSQEGPRLRNSGDVGERVF